MQSILKEISKKFLEELEDKKNGEKDKKFLEENSKNIYDEKDEIEKLYDEGKNQIGCNLFGESYIPKFDEEFSNLKKEEKSKEKIGEK
ncbi:hypothetical protein KST80_07715 [Fusobacterium polymorphum]|uniref:Uncharacterized protein n=1 Tax=Fusobacterium nucleatum subsp. polymorphum TaxID=76857 RepID=A0A1Z3CHH1_FUSNP|nr:hypothetical protein [Fusobacterium polymorphum]ASC03078.1 hypothetical protein CBG50_07050 [Fusobacterium polymorphum]PHI03803.1 hypothetical protein CBG54_12465 [Fusobacterium polymorphum]PHI16112.1 hypothetical protein CBG58_03230 [Fusobacterium polymorphum]